MTITILPNGVHLFPRIDEGLPDFEACPICGMWFTQMSSRDDIEDHNGRCSLRVGDERSAALSAGYKMTSRGVCSEMSDSETSVLMTGEWIPCVNPNPFPAEPMVVEIVVDKITMRGRYRNFTWETVLGYKLSPTHWRPIHVEKKNK